MDRNRNPPSITRGQQLRRLDAGGFVFTETIHPPGLLLPKHDHETANINLTLKGRFEETVCNRTYVSVARNLLIKPPGAHHSNRYGNSQVNCLIIEIRPERLKSLGPAEDLFDGPKHIDSEALTAIAFRIYKEFQLPHEVGRGLMVEGLALEMIAAAARCVFEKPSSRKIPRSLQTARDYIHENFTEDVSLSSVADQASVNPTYLAQLFRKHYHCSVGDYVRRLRIEYSGRELTQTRKPISSIALSAGFYDQSHFTRVFKDHTRMTPAEFRAAGRSG